MHLSVVVVNWNSREDLRACLQSLRDQTHPELEVIVVDNGSSDGSAEMVQREFGEFMLCAQSDNLGFAEACNRGIEASTSPWVAMLNNDTVADPDWAAELSQAAASSPKDCGMLQSLLLYLARPDTINSTGIELDAQGGGVDRDEGKQFSGAGEPEAIFCPTAGAAAYRRSMLEAVKLPGGYFDRHHFMYYEDMDLGWRARLAGWSALFVPRSRVLHRWHGSTDRHGRSWLLVITSINRIRTLLKNASLGFVARTSLRTFKDMLKVVWHGRIDGLRSLSRAMVESIAARPRITAMARRKRRAVEREWSLKPV